MNRHKIITALTAFAFGLFSFCEVAAFTKYVSVTVSGYSGAAMANYPVLVKLDAASIPGIYTDVKHAGADLKFTDDAGEGEYPYEVDTWNPSGTSYVWVKLPSFASGVNFRMYYGDVMKTTNPTAVNVWTGYDLVCHVNSNNANDSSANNFEGKLNPDGVSRSDGKIGNAYGMEVHGKGAAIVNKIYSGASGGALANPRFTYSFWVRLTATMTTWHVFAGNKTSNNSQTWGIDASTADGSQLRVWSKGGNKTFSTGGLPIGTWRKFDVVHDGMTTRIYVDGASVLEKTFDSAPYRDWSDWVGWGGNVNNNPGYSNESITGDFDECRIYASAMSADMIAVNYAVESRNDIFSFGAPQSALDLHKNRVYDVSANEQVQVFCEPGFYVWTPPMNASGFQLLVVGGGGAGGGVNGGAGGGGGQVIYSASVPIALGKTYSCVVGTGGALAAGRGSNGGESSFSGWGVDKIVALGGGGGGGNWVAAPGGDGANGGGGGGEDGVLGGNATVPGGFSGGKSSKNGNQYGAGGGGGAGGPGLDGVTTASSNKGGDGGPGLEYGITGETVMYGAGGGGTVFYTSESSIGRGGAGDGYGDSYLNKNRPGQPGNDGTGGGGGGGQTNGGALGSAGRGGHGTVIIRYVVQELPTSGVTVTVVKQSDAHEAGLVAGGFTFSCSEAARSVNYPVRYTVSGTAKPGQTYEELSGVVVIPAGQTSVVMPVQPLSDRVIDYDSTVTVTITPDPAYTVGSNSSATLTIINDSTTTDPKVRYVATDGADTNDGLSPTTAFASLNKALTVLAPNGGTVYVLPGTYEETTATLSALKGVEEGHGLEHGLWFSYYQVTNAVKIIGSGANPGDVVFKWKTCTTPAKQRVFDDGVFKDQGVSPRIFYLNHPKAMLKNLTVRGGRAGVPNGPVRRQECGGSNIFIDTEGGTVEDCLIDDGKMETWGVGGGGVQMCGGRVIRCRITNCVQGGQYAQYAPDTGYNIGSAIYMTGGVVENTLMSGNGIQYSGCTVMIRGNGKLLNCTIAGNTGLQCAGVAVQHEKAEVRNCAIFNNTCSSDSSGFGHVFGGKFGSGTDDEKKSHDRLATAFINCAADTFINEECIESADGGFVDQVSGDYHLGASSRCRDAAFGYQESGAESETDLDGRTRRMGVREDIGCYEYDPSTFACDFYADKTEALYRNDLGGTYFKFTAIVEGVYSGSLTYHWDFDGDGTYEVTTSNAEQGKTYSDANLGGTGYYTVGLKVVAGSGEAYARKVKYIHLAPPDVYVRTDSTGGTFPYRIDSSENAAPDLFTALTAAITGTTIHMAAGEYVWNGSNRPDVNAGVRILGATSDPKDTVVRYNKSSNKSNCMLLKVNHSDAFIANITWRDGFVFNDGSKMPACGIHITGNGGTISNCVIKGCSASDTDNGSAVAGVRMEAGTLTHCILEENCMYNVGAPSYMSNANSRKAQGLYATGPSRVENCLFRNMNTDGCLVVIGINSKGEAPEMRNCSIVDCSFNFWTDNNGDYANRVQWPSAAVECIDGNGKVLNTAFCHVRRRAYHNTNQDADIPAADCVPFSRNTRASTEEAYNDVDTDARCCTKCASDGVVPINSSCVLMTSADFENYAGGNLMPKLGGALYDAGQTIAGWSGLVDLAGKGRVVGRRIDIGCYEQQNGAIGGVQIYVDCSYDGSMGASDGSIERPWRTIQEGCAVAESTNTYVYVRGGTDRVYTITDCRDAGVLVADYVYLLGCDAEWNPATGYTDPGAMVTLAISDTYAGSSYALVLSSAFNAPITVNGARCRVSGFRSEFGANSFRSAQGGDGLINVFGSGSVIENCWFKGPDVANVQAGGRGVIFGGKTQGGHNTQNVAIRNCYFWLPNGNSVFPFFDLNDGTRFENCLVENVASLYFTDNQVSHANYYIISNIFLNCASTTERQLLGNGQNNMPYGGEIAYNRAIHNNGVPGYYVFIQHGFQYGNNWHGPTYIHHNTIVGYDFAFMKNYRGGSASQESGRAQNERYCWTPNIFDNLLVDVKTNIWECAVGLFDGNNTSSFKSGSTFYNNAIYNGELLGGPATTFSWYDLKDLTGTNTTITVDTNPPFVNTTDPHNDNYYRLRVPSAPWVVDAWVGDDPSFPDPDIPRYIGAVAPQPGGFAVRIR